MLIGFSLSWLWRCALRRRLISDDVTPQMARYWGARGLVTPAVFVLSMAIAYVSPVLASICPLLIVPGMRMVTRAYSRVD